MLNSGDAGLAFRAVGNPYWSGIDIGPVQVRVDPRSATARKHRGAWRLEEAHVMPVTRIRSLEQEAGRLGAATPVYVVNAERYFHAS
jgi:hypothetical protein